MSKEPRSLHGKVAVVTGGGRGIGKAIALALTSEGARVAIGDVDVPAAEAAAAELGGATVGLPLDVTDGPGYAAFLDDVEQRLGPIDILVNNAGIMTVGAPTRRTTRRAADDRDQPPRRDPRDEGGDAPVQAARHRPHRQRRLQRRQDRLPATSPPTARRSTASSGCPRPSAPSCAARASTSPA